MLYHFDNLVRDIVQSSEVLASKMKFYLRVFFFFLLLKETEKIEFGRI